MIIGITRAQFPNRLWYALLTIAIFGSWPMATADAAGPDGWRRGINHGDYLAYPQSVEWPIFRGPRASTSDKELRALADAGFDFIRLAVEPSPFLDLPAANVKVIERRLVSFVERAQAAGLKVMVSGWARHETTPRWRASQLLSRADGNELRTYLAFLERIITLLSHVPVDQWALEPMNEPQAECWRTDGPDWSTLQPGIYKHLRSLKSDLTIVVTPGCWSKQDALKHIDMPEFDDNTLVDVHYYEPWHFTHQGATWSVDWIKFLAGLAFPPHLTDRQSAVNASAKLFLLRNPNGTASEFAETVRQIDDYFKNDKGPDKIALDIGRIAEWAKSQRIDPSRIIIGEFGALLPGPGSTSDHESSRNRWLSTVRKAFEKERFGWANFAYHAEFGLIRDETTMTLDPDVLIALGLRTDKRN